MIYFDNSATTRPLDDVIALVSRSMGECYGNASSLHALGMEAERRLRMAAETLSGTVPCPSGGILFTSGGTESINTAIKGYLAANPRKGRHIVSTEGEHPAVLESIRQMVSRGYEATLLPLERNGRVDPDRLALAMRPDTALISILHVNNETGAITPPEEISGIRDIRCPEAVIHVDCVQSFGKLPTPFGRAGFDMASVSAHKIHGPKGVGALYIRPGLKLEPILHGGGQQHRMRSGTENVAGIEGLALAAQIAAQRRPETPEIVRQIRDRLASGLAGRVDHHILSPADAYPGILNIAFPGMPAEAMLHALESEGVYVSTGAACSSRKRKTSPVLRSMGIADSIAASAIRFSFSIYNSREEADAAAEAIVRILDRYAVRSTKNR